MAKIVNTSKWGRETARERYACGGMADGGGTNYLREMYEKIGSNETIDKRIRGEIPPLTIVPTPKSS